MGLLEVIAVLCQLNSSEPKLAQIEQAKCQAFYVKCLDRSAYPYDKDASLKACVLERAQ